MEKCPDFFDPEEFILKNTKQALGRKLESIFSEYANSSNSEINLNNTISQWLHLSSHDQENGIFVEFVSEFVPATKFVFDQTDFGFTIHMPLSSLENLVHDSQQMLLFVHKSINNPDKVFTRLLYADGEVPDWLSLKYSIDDLEDDSDLLRNILTVIRSAKPKQRLYPWSA